MYYIKYNNVDLTQMVKVREVSLPSLPEIEHDSIDLWDMDGNVFNSVSFGNRTITLRLLIQPLDPNQVEILTQDVKRVFYTREPQELYLGFENRYMLCVPEGEVLITELGLGTNELEVSLVAYYPYWISTEVKIENFTEKTFSVENKGDVPTTPIISLGIKEDTCFIQVDNDTTGERIFIGERPSKVKPEAKADDNVLLDECNHISGWSQSSTALDTGCGTGGTISLTDDGSAIMCGNFGNSSAVWKGAAYRKNLNTSLQDFKVRVDFTFNSTGTNGDPSAVQYMADCVKTESGGIKIEQDRVISGEKHIEYYSANPYGGFSVIRKEPSIASEQIGLMVPGNLFAGAELMDTGWLKVELPWETELTVGYVGVGDYEARVNTNQVVTIYNRTTQPAWTATLCNYVATTTAKIRMSPSENSPIRCTAPAGTVLRCIWELVPSKDEKENKKYWHVYDGYKGSTGYVEENELIRASEVAITYTQTPQKADDKTGKCQVYGFSSSGVQLFSLSLIDDSEWYEATYPVIRKNGQDFLTDISFNTPDPHQKYTYSNKTITWSNVTSGEYGSWNGFQGALYIERINNVWYAWVQGQRKKITSSKVSDNTNGQHSLSYIVIYFGTTDTSKVCDMAISRIRVQGVNAVDSGTQNIQYFERGDIVEIDCGIPNVLVNGVEAPSLVDIGSQFFDLQKGINIIRVSSDEDVTINVAYNERYL